MQASLRKSWPARLSALGFIAVIVFGNVWATYGITNQPVPHWLGVAMASGIGVTLLGGAGLTALIVWRKVHPLPEEPEEAEEATDAP